MQGIPDDVKQSVRTVRTHLSLECCWFGGGPLRCQVSISCPLFLFVWIRFACGGLCCTVLILVLFCAGYTLWCITFCSAEFQNAEGYDFDPGWVLLDGGGHRRSQVCSKCSVSSWVIRLSDLLVLHLIPLFIQGVSCSVGFGAVVQHEKSTCQLGVMHVCPQEDLTSKLECFSGTWNQTCCKLWLFQFAM